MSVQRLNIDTMRALAEGWRIDSRADLDNPFLAYLPPMLDAWVAEAKALDADERDATLKRMRAENRALDATHDGELEACYAYLTGLSAVHPQPDTVIAVRDTLMPDGRGMKTRSYQDQGVAAERARGRLTDDLKAQLRGFSPAGVDLVARFEAWIEAGLTLQRADRARAGIENQSPELERTLRRRWFTMLKAIRHGAELASLDDAAHARLFGKLQEALRNLR